jgi:8-oxo-dGTP diphosphatase
MRTIKVAAAIIINEDKIFASQRGYGEFKGMWEFPGGKIEAGETPKNALIREIMEELDTKIEDRRPTFIHQGISKFPTILILTI